jgi:hypothetical protein
MAQLEHRQADSSLAVGLRDPVSINLWNKLWDKYKRFSQNASFFSNIPWTLQAVLQMPALAFIINIWNYFSFAWLLCCEQDSKLFDGRDYFTLLLQSPSPKPRLLFQKSVWA